MQYAYSDTIIHKVILTHFFYSTTITYHVYLLMVVNCMPLWLISLGAHVNKQLSHLQSFFDHFSHSFLGILIQFLRSSAIDLNRTRLCHSLIIGFESTYNMIMLAIQQFLFLSLWDIIFHEIQML